MVLVSICNLPPDLFLLAAVLTFLGFLSLNYANGGFDLKSASQLELGLLLAGTLCTFTWVRIVSGEATMLC